MGHMQLVLARETKPRGYIRPRRKRFTNSLSLLKRVSQHNISTEPEVHLLCISGRDRSTSVEGIIEFEVGLEFGVGIGLERINPFAPDNILESH